MMPDFRGTLLSRKPAKTNSRNIFLNELRFLCVWLPSKIFETLCFVPFTGNGIGKSLLSKVAQVRIFLMTAKALSNFNYENVEQNLKGC